MMSSYWILP